MWAIGLHGGAAPLRGMSPARDVAALEAALAIGIRLLEQGAPAIDVVEQVIRALEDCACFIAGKGACPNAAGLYELDAAICDGAAQRAGCVAAMTGVYPPIAIARAVMDKTANVLLVGDGARDFARKQGFAPITEPERFFTPASAVKGDPDSPVHGTVGAVVCDASGAIAAGTSTGGTIGKRPGRVGDSPIIGAGTWADKFVGVSCTGQGEYFQRIVAAHAVAMRCRAGATLDEAQDQVIAEIGDLGGEGGLICVDVKGQVRYVFNTEAMRVAVANSDGLRAARIATLPSESKLK